jgi:dihydrofolate reductase
MGRVILDLSMSLDGFVAGTNIGPDNGLGDGGDRLHEWMFSSGTETGRSIERETFASAGAIVMGRRTFDVGKPHWDPDPQTFRQLPVFVLTHRAHEPIADPGGSTFTFVSDGIDSVLAQARTAASGRDVVLGGGASLGRQFLQAGLLDEMRIHLVHLLLGSGARLFDLAGDGPRPLQATRLVEDAGVTHFRFLGTAPPERER